MEEDGYVLVIGSSGADIKGQPNGSLEWGTPNLGTVSNSVGGVARNIAENLARLEVPTVLLTAVGKDSVGRRVIRVSEQAGINCNYVRYIPDARTGTYMALLKPDGQLHIAISDFGIMSYLDVNYIREHAYLIESAEMVVIDATLEDDVMAEVFHLTQKYGVRVMADPTTPSLAGRLCAYFEQLYIIVPNAEETATLCGIVNPAHDRETAVDAARDLVRRGVKLAVVTMGSQGLAYADGSGGGYLRAIQTDVVDATGAGDAFSAAAIFGLLNDVPVDEAMRLGITAAALTLASNSTVIPHLSQELLYDELMA